MTIDRKPCEQVHFIHYLIGGAGDGASFPSRHCYDTLSLNGFDYVRDGEPMPHDPDGGSWQALNCTDEYAEMIHFRVNMKPVVNP